MRYLNANACQTGTGSAEIAKPLLPQINEQFSFDAERFNGLNNKLEGIVNGLVGSQPEQKNACVEKNDLPPCELSKLHGNESLYRENLDRLDELIRRLSRLT